MSRPIKIAYSKAWYHVMNRGRRAENIFLEKFDYKMFVALLQETSEAWNIRIAAFCLMPTITCSFIRLKPIFLAPCDI